MKQLIITVVTAFALLALTVPMVMADDPTPPPNGGGGCSGPDCK